MQSSWGRVEATAICPHSVAKAIGPDQSPRSPLREGGAPAAGGLPVPAPRPPTPCSARSVPPQSGFCALVGVACQGWGPASFGEPHNPDVELARAVFALAGMEGQVDPVGGRWWVGGERGRRGVFDWQVVGGAWLKEAAGA